MAITHKKGAIINPAGKHIHCQAWVPDRSLRAILLLVHGLKEHGGRYGNLVQHFVPRGYGIYTCDLPGHGQSEGKRTYINRFQEYPDTVAAYTGQVQNWQPDTPIILYGHSMGSLIALHLLAHHPRPYQGVVFSSPPYTTPDDVSPLLIAAGKVLTRVWPTMRILEIDVDALSRDPQVIQAYQQDPLVVHKKTTARLGVELQRAIQEGQQLAGRIELPALILQGEEDKIIDPAGARHLHRDLASALKELEIIPDAYHELHNEPPPAREKAFSTLESWLERTL